MQPISNLIFLDFEEIIYLKTPQFKFLDNGFSNDNQTKCLIFSHFPMRFPIENGHLYSDILIFFHFWRVFF